LEKTPDRQTRTESKAQLIMLHIEQINTCLHAGDYSRALELLRSEAAEFPNDNAELSELEKLARDGIKRNAEAQRLITESQELFAQQKSTEAIQLLRRAYELDKNNSLSRTILANALVEQAHSMAETDWREAETLAKQALDLNPSHPTAKSIRSLILDRKKASPVEEWVAQARKLQSSGDLFAALSRVEEGLDIYPNDPKLLQTQDAIQRDQNLRRRQARRRDLQDLRRMELEIDAAADDAAKKTLADRIQRVAANYWTDPEVISVANGFLQRLGFVSPASSTGSRNSAVIFHVPPRSAPKPSPADGSPLPPNAVAPGPAAPNLAVPGNVPPAIVPPSKVSLNMAPPSVVVPGTDLTSTVPPSIAPRSVVRPGKVPTTPPEPPLPPPQPAAAEPSAPTAKVTPSRPKQPPKSNSATLILISAAAIILVAVAATFFFARRHQAPPVAQTQPAAPIVASPAVSVPAVSAPAAAAPAPTASDSAPSTPEPSPPVLPVSPDTAGKDDQPPAEPAHNLGTLLVVAGQDDAKVFLNGKLQSQLTRAGQLRLPNLELKDYVVQVSKSGFQDPPQQKIHIRQGEQARLVFNLQPNPQPKNLQPQPLQPQPLQPQPRVASLTIQSGAPETSVLVDQTLVGTIQRDGTLSVSTINPGDHTVELRKDGFKPRQFKKHFVAGGTVSLAAADAALEAASGELKITFSPPDATVALVKGDLLKMVSSGVPLNLAPGTYTLTARTAERFTRSSTLEVVAGQPRTLDLSLAPTGMSKWDDPSAWKHEGDSFIHKGGDFVLYGVAPASGTFVFSAMPAKGRLLQWLLNYADSKNYVLFQIDDKAFYRTVIRHGEKTDEIIVPHKGDKKSFRTLQIRVSPTEIVHQIKEGDSWTVLDRWTQPGVNPSLGKFGFYIPGAAEVALSSFSHYADLNLR
jgi:tetratricopeptide (TPR) repeat protein